MVKITKEELITEIAEGTGNTKKTVKEILDKLQEHIVCHVVIGNHVSIRDLGKFYPAERAARTARNPKTGESIEVPAKRALAFKPAASKKNL